MVFAGCSFTWGQGLYYYSNLPTLREPPPNYYVPSLLTTSQIKYMESVRYPRLVADHFKSFEMVNEGNGGSIDSIIHYWMGRFGEIAVKNQPDLYYQEYSNIIFQMTESTRTFFKFQLDGHEYEHCDTDKFQRWLELNNMDFDTWNKEHCRNLLQDVKKFLKLFESNGVKSNIIIWQDMYFDLIKEDPWLHKRFIPMEYDGVDYNSIEHLMSIDNKDEQKFNIHRDFDYFKVPPRDHHPSLFCHKVIAENIIKRLEPTWEAQNIQDTKIH